MDIYPTISAVIQPELNFNSMYSTVDLLQLSS